MNRVNYGLSIINFGEYHIPEKLIKLVKLAEKLRTNAKNGRDGPIKYYN